MVCKPKEMEQLHKAIAFLYQQVRGETITKSGHSYSEFLFFDKPV
jgi:hypothetical protein